MGMDERVKNILEYAARVTSTPKKKDKFINFCTNGFGVKYPPNVYESAWKFLVEKREEHKKNNNTNMNNSADNNQTKVENVTQEDRKRKRVDSLNMSVPNDIGIISEDSGSSGKKKKKQKGKKQVTKTDELQDDQQIILTDVKGESIKKKGKKKKIQNDQNDEVGIHTSCVSEQESYSPKNYVLKPPSCKGKEKQENWIQFVQAALSSNVEMDERVKKVLEYAARVASIPRKEDKFINFCTKGFRFNYPPNVYESAWKFLVEKREEHKKNNNGSQNNSTDSNQTEVKSATQQDQKRKRVDSLNVSVVNGDGIISEGKKKKKQKGKKLETKTDELQNDQQIIHADFKGESKKEKEKKKKLIQNDEVGVHTSCVTEKEQFSAKNDVLKSPSCKGKEKQENWIQFVRAALSSNVEMDERVKKVLESVSRFTSIPRKKDRFINFCTNGFRFLYLPSVYESAWEFLVEKREEHEKNNNASQNNSTDSNETEVENVTQEDRKRKRVDSLNMSVPIGNGIINEDSGSSGKKKKKQKSKKQETKTDELQDDKQIIHTDLKGESKKVKEKKKKSI